MPTWPSTLGYPDQAYEVQPQDALERTEFEDGPQLQRQVRSAPETLFRVRFSWRQEQWAVFDWFFQRKIQHGAAWFDGLTLLTPAGFQVLEAQIRQRESDRYQSSAFPGQVTLTIAVRDRGHISDDLAAFLQVYSISDLERAAALAATIEVTP